MSKPRQGRLENAIEYYYRAIAVDPNHPDANLSVAKAWGKLGNTGKSYRHMQLHMESRKNDKTGRRNAG